MNYTIVDKKTGSKTLKDIYQIIAYKKLVDEGITDIDFNKKNHIYKKNGVIITSVTQILSLIGSWNYGADTSAADRGTYLHRICDLYDMGKLDISKIDTESKNIIKSWQSFKDDFNLSDKENIIENRFYSKKYNFSGSVDNIFKDTFQSQLIIVYLKETGYKAKIVKFNNEKFREFQCFQITHKIKNL